MRDPLAEFAEVLVAAMTGHRLAESPVQKGWDLISDEGIKTQVRYVANASGTWVNEHAVDFRSLDCQRYALVVFEDLEPTGIYIFDRTTLGLVYTRLKKRQACAGELLLITQRNIAQIRAERDVFGVEPYRIQIFP